MLACQQIKSEETTIRKMDATAGSSHRTVACLTTTLQFAKARPQLLVNHLQTRQPYLNVRTQELTVPLIKHPSKISQTQQEEASMKPNLLHDKTVVSTCSLAAVTSPGTSPGSGTTWSPTKRCMRRTQSTRGFPRPEGGGGDQKTTQYNPEI